MSNSPRDDGGRGRSRSRSRRNDSPRGRSHSKGRDGDRRDRDSDNGCQIYVAKLHRNTRESDLKEAFAKFGKIKEIVLKHNYCFICYEDSETAEQAVREMNGKAFVNGEELVVEQSGREHKTFWIGSKKNEFSAGRKEKEHWTTERWCLLQVPKEGSLVSTIAWISAFIEWTLSLWGKNFVLVKSI